MKRKQRGFLLNPFRFGPGNFFASVSILLHGDGSDGSTTITDSSSNSHACTANGNAQISTDEYEFGGSSIKFDGTNSYISVPDSAVFAMPGDFTVEGFVYVDPATPAWSRLVENQTYNAFGGWHIRFNGNDSAGARRIGVQIGNPGTTPLVESDGAFPTGVMTHYALCRSLGVFSQYINGVKQAATLANTEVFTSQKLRIGCTLSTPENFFKGFVEEFRITKGLALYTDNFTPPSSPFPDA